jgi:hypothetical protein
MLENGQDLYIWLGRDISSDYLQAVFGTDDLQHVDPRQVQLMLWITHSIVSYVISDMGLVVYSAHTRFCAIKANPRHHWGDPGSTCLENAGAPCTTATGYGTRVCQSTN